MVVADIWSVLLSLLLATTHLGVSVRGDPVKSVTGQKMQVAGPSLDLGNYTRAGCDNFTGDTWQPLRPAFHITVPYGWMNDPHGMFQLKNSVHLFFQYNPKGLAWAAPFWGHVVSKDLAHWTWVPPALLPDTMYDFSGVWSGAATIADGDVPVLTYTAASTEAPEVGNFFQRQAMAVPADINDPLLKKWVKPTTNPFLMQVPPGGTNFQFRDPTEGRHGVWLALTSKDNPRPLNSSHYALAIGVQVYCMGGAGIYSAPTMAGPWTFQGSLYNQLMYEPEVNGQCMASRSSSTANWPGPAYGGPCDQFGAHCRMWEVVDFAELDQGVYFLKWDDQSHFRDLFSMEWYVLGNGPWDYTAVHPDLAGAKPQVSKPPTLFGAQYSDYPGASKTKNVSVLSTTHRDGYNNINNWEASATRSLFKGEIDGQRFAPMRTDYGSIYASMVFRTTDKRQVMFSWIYETAAGCKAMCSDELPEVIKQQGFKGVQTLPRQLTYEPTTKTLRAYPVVETNSLRGKQVHKAAATSVAAFPAVTQLVYVDTVPGYSKDKYSVDKSSSKLSAATVLSRQFEIQVSFTLLPPGNSSTSKVTSEAGQHGSGAGMAKNPDKFACGVRIELGNGKFADAFIKGSVRSLAPQSPAYALSDLSLWFDRRQAGGSTNVTFMEGGPIPLPVDTSKQWQAPNNVLELSVWVDHGVVEIFAMKGLARITSRIYPDDDSVAWGVSAWAIAPKPTAGVTVDRAAASRAAEALKPPTVLSGMYCWWCRTWSEQCKDTRCYSAISRWPAPGSWGVLMDSQVWEMQSAWLPPSC